MIADVVPVDELMAVYLGGVNIDNVDIGRGSCRGRGCCRLRGWDSGLRLAHAWVPASGLSL